MAQTCPRCSRRNPAAALYCFHDGAPLPGHAHQARLQGTLPIPFVFPSGQSCHSYDQLALACYDNWSAARDLLIQGAFTGYFQNLGRADLAAAAREAARLSDLDRGLDLFLARLPTQNGPAPKLHVEPTRFNLGLLRAGRDVRTEIRLSNLGRGLVHGSVACEDSVWLGIGDPPGSREKHFQFLDEAVIPLQVRGKQLRAGTKPIEARLTVESNAGTSTVVVQADVPVIPFPDGVLAGANTPRQIAERARSNPREAAAAFEQGSVARWYEANGWTYPVPDRAASGVAAVQQFFEALGLTDPPRVSIDQQAVQIKGSPGEVVRHALVVSSAERRPVYAWAVSDQPWLEVRRTHLEGNTATVRLKVSAVPDRPGEQLRAQVIVTANGNQRFVVPVTLAINGNRRAAVDADIPEVIEVVEPEGYALVEVIEEPERPRRSRREPLPRVLDPDERDEGQRGFRWSALLHLWPVAFLVFVLSITVARDLGIWLRSALVKPRTGPAGEPLGPGATIAVHFHDEVLGVTLGQGGVKPEGGGGVAQNAAEWDPSMRFGLVMVEPPGRLFPGSPKRLTFEDRGLTNNTVVRLDGGEHIFGEQPFRTFDGRRREAWPGRWFERDAPLPAPRDGRRSVWVYDPERVRVTQTVEIVPGPQTGVPDTCLIRYRLENRDRRPHEVGLRFMLDTFIGANDGVPFLIPGVPQLVNTQAVFKTAREVPDFIQARESDDLTNPGTIAQVQLRLEGLEAPSRVTLGAWPNPRLRSLNPLCGQEKTLWEVPVLSMQTLNPADSAVVIYWDAKPLRAGQSREVGFGYGLGTVAGSEGGGQLAVTVGGSFTPGGEFTVTAYVREPRPGQTVTLEVPAEFELIGEARQPVPRLASGAASRSSPVSWKVRAGAREGTYTLKVSSSSGVSQTQRVRIKIQGIFGG